MSIALKTSYRSGMTKPLAIGGELGRALIQTGEEDHRVYRADLGVRAIGSIMSVDLTKVLIGENDCDLSA